jgi:hypothetical protein
MLSRHDISTKLISRIILFPIVGENSLIFHLCDRWDLKDEIAAEALDEMAGVLLHDRLMMVEAAVDFVVVVAVAVGEMVTGASFMLEIWLSRLRVRTCANTSGRCDLAKCSLMFLHESFSIVIIS